MEKSIHLLLSCWIASHIGHAVLSTFYEKPPRMIIVLIVYAAFILMTVAAWRRNRRAVRSCALLATATLIIQGLFIWNREPYGSLSIAVLVFDVLAVVASVAY